ncbi:hypothetical protein HY224_00370, partial [Candidatus Uhrbacteria bacterium]|nr:hypothetical protein [Candidatus Uhrbacteria bacterium]
MILGILFVIIFAYFILFLKRGTEIAQQIRFEISKVSDAAGHIKAKFMSS